MISIPHGAISIFLPSLNFQGKPATMAEYFELRDALAEVIGCPVDLVMAGALRNPYILADIERARKLSMRRDPRAYMRDVATTRDLIII